MLGIVLVGIAVWRTGQQDEGRTGLWPSTSDTSTGPAAPASCSEEASRTIPGGAGSSARTVKFGWSPTRPSSPRARVADVRRRRQRVRRLPARPRTDDPRPPAPGGHRAVTDAISRYGTCFGLPYELEIEAAEKVVAAVPGIEQVRFTNSGSEAVGTAVRLARATPAGGWSSGSRGTTTAGRTPCTGATTPTPPPAGPAAQPRPVAAGPGVPAELADTLIVLSWNDPESFAAVMDERGHEVAAVITEAAVFNTGCILPEPGYLELLRAQTTEHGALLIFDEVITGFRFCRGGAQEWFGVTPDLTTLAKGLGGGFPVAAIGGSTEAMRMIAEGRYSHSGTYNANVVQCAAVSATMDVLAEPGLYERQRAIGDRLAVGLRKLAADAGHPGIVEGLGTVFQLWFSAADPRLAGRRSATRTRPCSPAGTRRCSSAGCFPPAAVREPVRLPRPHRRGRRPDSGRGGGGVRRLSASG